MTEVLIQILAAFAGTAAFSVLFSVSPSHRLRCGFIGAVGWSIYLLVDWLSGVPLFATFVSALVLTVLSRLIAVGQKTPTIVFLIPGIFTLVPGGGIFYTAYYLFFNLPQQAMAEGFGTLKTAIAIALGIAASYSVPASVYGWKRDAETWYESDKRNS